MKISLMAAAIVTVAGMNANAQPGIPSGAPTPGIPGDHLDPTAEEPKPADQPPLMPPIDRRGDTMTDPIGVVPTPQPVPAQPLPPAPAPLRPAPVGAGLLLGGGFEDFTNGNLRTMTGGGAYWTARAVTGMRQYMGLEAAYVGSSRSINALGLNSNAVLASNGVEGALRANFPIVRGRSLLVPFGFVGLGWHRYNLQNVDTNNSDVANRDDVMTLPYGAGLQYAYGMFLADARFTYRYAYQNDLLRTTGGRLNNYGFGLQAGVTF